MLEQGRDVGLISRDAVQGLGEHDVEPAMLGVLQQQLDARPKNDAGAGDRGVMIGIDDLPTLPARMLTTDAQLVLDGHHALIVRRVAGVKRNLWHGLVSRLSLTSIQPFTPISRHKLIERPKMLSLSTYPANLTDTCSSRSHRMKMSLVGECQVQTPEVASAKPTVAVVYCHWRRPGGLP
jgi:hypothetical protein